MDLDEFERRFSIIRSAGFVRSMRRGPTGIGYTLESLLEIRENNHAKPDIDGAELKATRSSSGSLITLFTMDRGAWEMKPLDAIRNYGTTDANGRRGLYFTLSARPSSTGLLQRVDDTHVSVEHMDGTVVAKWSLASLAAKLAEKLPRLLLVTANCDERSGIEYFHFSNAVLLSDPSPTRFAEHLEAGNISIDLRLHERPTSARNHGTAFRAHERLFSQLFENKRVL